MKLNSKVFRGVVLMGVLMATAVAAQADNRVVEPGQKFGGKSYNELAGEWTNWLTQEPFATNPALDPDGRYCDLNQQGNVWFLASTFGGVVDRTCEIPAGKAIFLSLGGVFVSFAPEFPAANDACAQAGTVLAGVRCDVNDDVPVAPAISFEVTLDGVAVEDLFAYRAQSQPGGFTLEVPNPSFLTDLGLPAGDRSPAVADGYFLYLKPLDVGRHTLSLRMTNPDQSQAGVDYTLVIRN